MERLSGQDAYCLYRETPTVQMHTLKVAVCDPPQPPQSREQLLKTIEKYLHLLPPLRRRLVFVPFGFHHPVWIEDPDFDLDWHVRRIGVPAPGGQRELDEVVSEIARHRLERSRPLWELWVLDGLAGSRIAYVFKLHHAVADGVASAALITHSAERVAGQEPPAPERPWTPEAVPSAWRLLADAVADHLSQIVQLPALIVRTARRVRALLRWRKEAAVTAPGFYDAPDTRFNKALGLRRLFVTTSLPLDVCQDVKQHFGVTLNDVVLGLCAGALHRYLNAHGELPNRPLSVGVPVSVSRDSDEPRLYGNHIASMQTALRVDLEDPVERLLATREITNAAKEELELLGRETMSDWMNYLPPLPYTWLRRIQSQLRLADRYPSPTNLVVSNVPGPREPLFWSDNRMVDLYSVGPLSEGIGLNFTVWSYCGRMYVTALACRDAIPDLQELVDCVHVELDALTEAARRAAHDVG